MKKWLYLSLAVLLAVALWYGFQRHRKDAAKSRAGVEELKRTQAEDFTAAAGEYLINRAKQGQLPGFSKGDQGTMFAPTLDPAKMQSMAESGSRLICSQKKGDESEYCYIVVRNPKDGALRLAKAWRVSRSGKLLEEYRVP